MHSWNAGKAPAWRRTLLWLLALVLPLQGLATTLIQVRGPAHVHGAATTTLSDFRRVDVGSASLHLRQHADSAGGALHTHDGAVARHHHALDDSTVTYVDGDRFADSAANDGVTGDGAAAFLPLLPAPVAWAGAAVRDARPPIALWTPTAAVRVRLDRPPQIALA